MIFLKKKKERNIFLFENGERFLWEANLSRKSVGFEFVKITEATAVEQKKKKSGKELILVRRTENPREQRKTH